METDRRTMPTCGSRAGPSRTTTRPHATARPPAPSGTASASAPPAAARAPPAQRAPWRPRRGAGTGATRMTQITYPSTSVSPTVVTPDIGLRGEELGVVEHERRPEVVDDPDKGQERARGICQAGPAVAARGGRAGSRRRPGSAPPPPAKRSRVAREAAVLRRMKGSSEGSVPARRRSAPPMNGMVTPKRSRRKRLTVPLRPRICWKATAPTRAGSPAAARPARPGATGPESGSARTAAPAAYAGARSPRHREEPGDERVHESASRNSGARRRPGAGAGWGGASSTNATGSTCRQRVRRYRRRAAARDRRRGRRLGGDPRPALTLGASRSAQHAEALRLDAQRRVELGAEVLERHRR